jgi:predicted DNA-binding protein with PD1-like motif
VRFSEAKTGRVFIIRLEDGDRLPDALERFASEQGIDRAVCFLIGGAGDGSRIVVGPEDGAVLPPAAMVRALCGVHEMAGVGTIFPDEQGRPALHLHAAFGREGETRTGCVRPGVDIWKVGEVVLLELLGGSARRERDPETGFSLLRP